MDKFTKKRLVFESESHATRQNPLLIIIIINIINALAMKLYQAVSLDSSLAEFNIEDMTMNRRLKKISGGKIQK